MSSNFDNRSFLSCGICKCVLKEPVLAPCLHSFCKSCLETPPSDRNLSSPCDGCSQFLDSFTTGDWDSLNVNSFIESLTYMIDPCSDSIKCKACERVDQEAQSVTHFCTDCDEHMCEGCIMVHDNFLPTMCHNKLTLAEYQSIGGKVEITPGACKRHSKEILKLFCKGCKTFLCKNCVEENALSTNPQCKHDLHDVKTIATESRQSVSFSLDEARANLTWTKNRLTDLSVKMTSFNHEQRRAVEEMDAQRTKLIELINKAYEESKRSFLERTEEQMAHFNKKRNQLEIHIDDLSRLISKTSATLDLIPDVEMIKGCSRLKTELEVIPPDVKVQSAKFEFCRLLDDERLAAHVRSALGYFVEHKVCASTDGVNHAVYAQATGSIFVGTHEGVYEVTTFGRRQLHGGESHRLSLSDNQMQLYSLSLSRKVNVFEVGQDGEFQYSHTFTVPRSRSNGLTSLSLSPGSRFAVLVLFDGLLVRDNNETWTRITDSQLGFHPCTIEWLDDDKICVQGGDCLIRIISLNQPNHGQHILLWKKRCHGNQLYFEGGMIFISDGQTFNVLSREGVDVGILTCPEGAALSVCTMKSGMLMAISRVLREN